MRNTSIIDGKLIGLCS